MRKILYSPGYGAGWTSWCSDREVKKLMLEYRPIVEALERGEVLLPEKYRFSDNASEHFHPSIKQLITDIAERFGEDAVPYLAGAYQLTIAEIPDGARVRITECAGSEDYEIEGEYEGWM